jgi:hypothetical protein
MRQGNATKVQRFLHHWLICEAEIMVKQIAHATRCSSLHVSLHVRIEMQLKWRNGELLRWVVSTRQAL